VTRLSHYQIAFSTMMFVLGVGTLRGGETCGGMGLPAPARRQKDKPFSEEVRFRAAESLYQRRLYPQAADAYRQLLAAFPTGCHRKQVVSRLFDIARYWLKDSWEAVGQVSKLEGKDWIVWLYPCDVFSNILPDTPTIFRRALFCRNLFHKDKTKPFFNEEGRAIELLAFVHASDPGGPLADKTLFLMGHLHYFREDYRRANECFSRLLKKHPNSLFVLVARELAIKAKLMVADCSEKDAHLFAEAKKLIFEALRERDHSDERKRDLVGLLRTISVNQAEIAFKAAEACQLADQIERACSQYELICDNYPNSYCAMRAKERLEVLKSRRTKMRNRSSSSISRP
jgi:tetratricopeptide (TPR) repeat protein